MSRQSRTLARFEGGLVTDRVGVKGSLLEARDWIPLERENGWRVRGGKGASVEIPGAVGQRGMVGTSVLRTAGHHGLATVELADTSRRLRPIRSTGGVGDALTSSVVLPTGATAAFDGRINNFAAASGVDFGRELWAVPGDTRMPVRWAGVMGEAAYSSGTVSGASGSATVSGTNTAFDPQRDMGRYLHVNDPLTGMRAYRIVAVLTGSSLQLDRPLPATFAGVAYRITSAALWTVAPNTWGRGSEGSPLTGAAASMNFLNARDVTQHAARVFAVNCIDADGRHYPDRARWCAVEFETDSLYGGGGDFGGAEYWHRNAYLDIAPGRGGPGLLYVRSVGTMALFFKQRAVFALRGFVETDGRDVGASIDTISSEVGAGMAAPVVTELGAFFADEEAVYLVGENAQVLPVTDRDGIRGAYRELLAGGEVVHLSWAHRRLIIQSSMTRAQAVAGDTFNTLVWHADQGVWCTQQTTETGQVLETPLTAAAVGRAGGVSAGRLVDWQRDVSNVAADDGGQPVLASITTHAFPLTGGMNGRLRGALVRGKLVDTATNDPTLALSVLLGEEGTTTAVEAAVAGSALLETGDVTEGWHRVPVRAGTPLVDTARIRLRQTAPSADVKVYEVGVEHVAANRTR